MGLFGAVTGLTGPSVAWRLAASRYGVPPLVADAVGRTAPGTFWRSPSPTAPGRPRYRQGVAAELCPPLAGDLFGTALISLRLPLIRRPANVTLAHIVRSSATTGMILFAVAIVDRWMSCRRQVAHATPAGIVPVVGLLDISPAAPALGLPHAQTLTLRALSAGLYLAAPPFKLVFSRLPFAEPLPAGLRPTVMILFAPFAAGFCGDGRPSTGSTTSPRPCSSDCSRLRCSSADCGTCLDAAPSGSHGWP